MRAIALLSVGILVCAWMGAAQAQGPEYCQFPLPKSYVVYKLGQNEKIVVDGKLDEAAWGEVAWTDPFQDIQGPSLPKPRFNTVAKMRWDEDYLYIGGYIQEPQIWANQTEHNSVIFYDNDFEVFIDPNGSNAFYKEYEMNALNTNWNLYLNKPYIDGGSPTNNWDVVPILSGVYIDGKINDPKAVNNYWTVEIALPFKSLGYLQKNLTVPPQPKDQWRINFSRVEYHVTVVNGEYQKVPNLPEDNWVWSSQDVVNMHLPEKWGFIQFSADAVNSTAFVPDPYWTLRSILLQVYYAEKKFAAVTGYFTPEILRLNLPDFIPLGKCAGVPIITPNQVTIHSFQVQVDYKGVTGYINQDRLLWLTNNS